MNPERVSNDERQDNEFAAARAPASGAAFPSRITAIARRRPIRAVLLAAAVFAIPYSLARHRADGPAAPEARLDQPALPMGPVTMETVSGNSRTTWHPPVGMDRNNESLDRLTLDLTSPTQNPSPGSAEAAKDAKDAKKEAKSAPKHAAATPEPAEVPAPQPAPKTHVATAAPEAPEHKASPAHATSLDEVDQYLWKVYERSTTKKDATGDFTWKDEAAAARLGLVTKQYVIEGMDPDFRELLYDLGHAMDDAGIKWMILSGFRDDYRQGLASGYKAHVGNSFHGGSRATGGYGHGCAADIEASDGDGGDNNAVWRFVDQHGEKFGIFRPMKGIDPAHVQPYGNWHDVALNLRTQNSYLPASLDGDGAKVTPLVDSPSGVSESQFDCVRSHHHPDFRMAGWHRHGYPSMHRYMVFHGRPHRFGPPRRRIVVDAGVDRRTEIADREKFAKAEATARNKRDARPENRVAAEKAAAAVKTSAKTAKTAKTAHVEAKSDAARPDAARLEVARPDVTRAHAKAATVARPPVREPRPEVAERKRLQPSVRDAQASAVQRHAAAEGPARQAKAKGRVAAAAEKKNDREL